MEDIKHFDINLKQIMYCREYLMAEKRNDVQKHASYPRELHNLPGTVRTAGIQNFPTMLCRLQRKISTSVDILKVAMAAMDTDEQHNHSTPQTNLRRSHSAPLINGANISETSLSFLPTLTPRQRRSSTSQMANHNHHHHGTTNHHGVPVVSGVFCI